MIAAACVVLAGRLSELVEVKGLEPGFRGLRPPLRSRTTIRRLAALFAVDSFGGGFIVQSFLVFWFHRKFGASAATMGLVFFGTGLLQAWSSIAAVRLGRAFGLLNTMVFTHIPSNLLLIAIPFMPNLVSAVALLMGRFALSQMDVPTRQAYLAAAVAPEERTPAAAYTNTARYATRPAGPVIGGALMQHVALAGPFVAGGLLKIVYDVVMYGLFRRIPIASEQQPSSPSTSSSPSSSQS